MTVQEITENVQEVFPDVGSAQVVKEIDRAQKYFVELTNILEKSVDLSDIVAIASNYIFTLPADFIAVKEILLYDSVGDPVFPSDLELEWYVDKANSKLVFYSTSSTTISGIDASVATAYMVYYYVPTTITIALDVELLIPEEFHEGIYAKVMEKAFAKYRTTVIARNGMPAQIIDHKSIQYWRGEFQVHTIRARQQMRDRKDKTRRDVILHEYAGTIDFPKSKEV